MAEHRGTAIVLLAFAVSLAALGVGAGSGYARCGGGSNCSYELALSIVAFAPAALIAASVALLMRARAGLRWLRWLLLAAGVGLAIAPLAAFVLRDVWAAPVFGALIAALLLLLLVAERDEGVEARGTPAEVPEPAERTPVPEPALEAPLLEPEPAYEAPALAGPLVISADAFAAQVAVLNDEVARMSDKLREIQEPATLRPRSRVRLYLLDQQASL